MSLDCIETQFVGRYSNNIAYELSAHGVFKGKAGEVIIPSFL